MKHLLCSSVVFLHTVDVVTEVDGHDAVGVVSVHNCEWLKVLVLTHIYEHNNKELNVPVWVCCFA